MSGYDSTAGDTSFPCYISGCSINQFSVLLDDNSFMWWCRELQETCEFAQRDGYCRLTVCAKYVKCPVDSNNIHVVHEKIIRRSRYDIKHIEIER